ncbi:MAG: hypothetical protein JRH20_21480 [Deltaproteobacteria bacterium]|nr:hypothetical protein [Deltaproteobacteria bacterium]
MMSKRVMLLGLFLLGGQLSLGEAEAAQLTVRQALAKGRINSTRAYQLLAKQLGFLNQKPAGVVALKRWGSKERLSTAEKLGPLQRVQKIGGTNADRIVLRAQYAKGAVDIELHHEGARTFNKVDRVILRPGLAMDPTNCGRPAPQQFKGRWIATMNHGQWHRDLNVGILRSLMPGSDGTQRAQEAIQKRAGGNKLTTMKPLANGFYSEVKKGKRGKGVIAFNPAKDEAFWIPELITGLWQKNKASLGLPTTNNVLLHDDTGGFMVGFEKGRIFLSNHKRSVELTQ